MLPSIGSYDASGRVGQPGVVIATRKLGEARDGQQRVELTVLSRAPQGSAAAAAGPATAGPASQVAPPLTGLRTSSLPQPLLSLQEQPSSDDRSLVQDPTELTPEERAVVEQLRIRDQQVRQEEQAHAANAGDLAGPISYTTVTGPDGRSYAVGGSVGIRAQAASGDPAEAERIGARLAAAAHAAVNPSAQDLAVARQGYGFAEAAAGGQQPGAWFDVRA